MPTKPRSNSQLSFKFLDFVIVLFVATLLISNIGSTKIVGIGPLTFDGGTVLFPIAYILGDVLTEVYGFQRARRVIWTGFVMLLLMALTLMIIQYLPAASGWDGQDAYVRIAGFVPRLVAASMIAYLAGEFTNSIVLVRMKLRSRGRHFWFRSIVSSIAGELLDTVVFSTIAFAGTMPGSDLLRLIATVYLMKIAFEAVMLPVTTRIVALLKRKEQVDIFDDPASLKLM